jgi:hypothetical protein
MHVPFTSHLCVQSDIESDWFAFWCHEMQIEPAYHRKHWEFCFVAQALFNSGLLRPGSVGIGFGCGSEPLPSLFAKYGVHIVATDQDPATATQEGWVTSNEHATDLKKLRRSGICPDADKLDEIELQYLDMNDLPPGIGGRFDFCWSACAVEHLGSIEKGLSFVENSVATLKPGGVAAHTLEFNVGEDEETIDNWSTVLFQKRHVEKLVERLTARGHQIAPLDFSVGTGFLDHYIDLPPWNMSMSDAPVAHLRLSLDGFVCTSFGLIVTAGPRLDSGIKRPS